MTENKMICQQNWGLWPEASFPTAPPQPWLSLGSSFLLSDCQNVAVVGEDDGEREKRMEQDKFKTK